MLCFTVWKLFGSHVLLNKRRLTGNQPGSTRHETGGKNRYRNTPITNIYSVLLFHIVI